MTRFDLELAAQLSALHAGLAVDPDKPYLVESRLGPVARRAGLASVEDLMLAIREGADDALVTDVVEALSPTPSAFFWEAGVLERLAGQVLPAMAAVRPSEPVKVWVAAAGAGQEAFSLAILLQEQGSPPGAVDLLATDLNERSLEKARSGAYSQFEVQLGLSARRLVRWFEKSGETFVPKAALRQAIRWERRNLIEPPSGPAAFDIVICRQALPFMTSAGRGRALANLTASLRAKGGILALGAADPAPPGMTRLARGLYAHLPQARAAAA